MTNWKDVFFYQEASGTLVWRSRTSGSATDARFNTKTSGRIAGSIGMERDGGVRGIVIGYRGKDLYAHRIIWEMHNGPIPAGMMIDHINGNPLDNRTCNLRLATREQNYHNQGLSGRNTSGIKGVHFDKARGKWRAEIRFYNKIVGLGRFETKGLAAVARAKAAIRYHGAFARI